MDIEDLNKTQLLLLTLLVNFVTSIAVGVLTVSLLADDSPTITQTVNRIVERTVETVGTAPTVIPSITSPQPSAPVTSDDDRRAAALSEDAGRRVAIFRSTASKEPIATGVYLPKARAVVTASGSLPAEVVITFADGSTAPASRSRSNANLIIYGFSDTAALPTAPSPAMLAVADLKQGQTALGIATDGTAVRGIITKVDGALVSTDLTGIPAGGSAVNLDGDLIGVANGVGGFIPASAVAALLAEAAS